MPLDENGGRTVSLAFVFLLSTQVLFGWQYAVLSAIVEHDHRAGRRSSPRPARRLQQRLLRHVGVRVGGPRVRAGVERVSPHDAERLTLLVFVGGATYVIVNVITVAIAVSLYTGVPIRTMLEDYVRHSGPAFGDHGFHRGAGDVAVDGEPAPRAAAGRAAVRAGAVPALRLPHGAGDARRRDGRADAAAKPPLVPDRPARGAGAGRLDPLAALAGAGRHRQLQEHQRPLRPSGRRPGADDPGRRCCATSTAMPRPTGSAARSSRCSCRTRATRMPTPPPSGCTRGCGRRRSRTASRSPSAPASRPTPTPPPTATSCCGWPTARSTGRRITARTAPASTAQPWCGSTRPRSWPRRPSGTRGCGRPRA